MGWMESTHRDDGTRNHPGIDSSWDEWVSASSTRNWCLDDPLLDWLDLYGRENGFVPDHEKASFDPRCDFSAFVMRKGREFEEVAVSFLGSLFELETIATEPADSRNLEAAEATFQAMAGGREIIAQGVLWNPQLQVYGMPDLLVRSDVLGRLFPDLPGYSGPSPSASDLPAARGWHYRVIDIKYATLDLLKDGHGGSSHLHYQVQVCLYNQALGRLQGYEPPSGFLFGRGWKQSGGRRGTSSMDALERVEGGHFLRKRDASLDQIALAACAWRRRVKLAGGEWRPLPNPTNNRLRPNLKNREDSPWHGAKREIAAALEDLTTIYHVSPSLRDSAIQDGLSRWSDPGCRAERLGLKGKTGQMVDAILAANHSPADGPLVFPERFTVPADQWRQRGPAEFFVDFETVSDLDDDFRTFPEKGGSPLIFMVGVGWLEEPGDIDSWRFEVFTADRLDQQSEGKILANWVSFLREMAADRGSRLEDARLYHWSDAEVSFLKSAYNAAAVRHGVSEWDDLPWVDLMKILVKAQPVSVRGAWGFGLKAIAKSMNRAGLIPTSWEDGPADGLGAMAGAWWCGAEASERGVTMREMDLMREIEAYNEVDCRVMAEILEWFRANR